MWNPVPRLSFKARHLPFVALSLAMLGSTALSTRIDAQQTTATEPAVPTQDTAPATPVTEAPAGPSTEEALAAVGLPADLDTLTQAELIAIVKDFALQQAMQSQPSDVQANAEQPGDTAAPASRLAALEAQVKLLTNQLRIATARIAALKQSPPELPPAPPPESPAPAPPAEVAGNTPADAADEPAPPDNTVARTRRGNNGVEGAYLYRYEYGLIEAGSKERRVLRDRNGVVTGSEFSDTNYRKDAVWVRVIFQNRADQPLRYTGLAALGRRPSPFNRPEMITTVSFSTHVLQPGEVYEFEREVNVDNPFKVDFVEVGRVLAITPGEGE